jgi:regulator of protease activity HflC (stomatin/prohibitin superfamily)
MRTTKIAAKITLITLAVSLSGCGIHTVGTGHRGIKTRFGNVEGPPLTEGLWFVNPITTSIHEMDVRIQRWDGDTEAYTRDVQEAKVKFTLNYKLRPEAAADIYRTVGEDWSGKLVGQQVYQHLKDVIGQWDAVDLIANRQKANDQALAAISTALGNSSIDVTGFSITDFEFSPAFNAAVEAKVIAQQRAQEAQNRTEQIKQEAQQKVIAATAEAQSMKIRADALTQNPKLVSWEAVQKWDGKLPVNMYGQTAIPFIDVGKDGK